MVPRKESHWIEPRFDDQCSRGSDADIALLFPGIDGRCPITQYRQSEEGRIKNIDDNQERIKDTITVISF